MSLPTGESENIYMRAMEDQLTYIRLQNKAVRDHLMAVIGVVPAGTTEKDAASDPDPVSVRCVADGTVTVFYWKDGTYTSVRRSRKDAPDLFHAWTAAWMKKSLGSASAVEKTYRSVRNRTLAAEKSSEA